MKKNVGIKLRDFDPIPQTLQSPASSTTPKDSIQVPLGSLFHHLYLDTYGLNPPDPNPVHPLYLRFLQPFDNFEFIGNGLGSHTEPKKNRSNEFGKAFCRWFLSDHCGLAYFAHVSDLLDRDLDPLANAAGMRIVRRTTGDTPDYFCADAIGNFFVAESKGRYSVVPGFSTQEFQKWRDQFGRIQINDTHGVAISTKGYIVATQFACEIEKPKKKTIIVSEDPRTPGINVPGEQDASIYRSIVSLHYSRIMSKLGLPVIEAALQTGFTMSEQFTTRRVVWKCLVSPYDKFTFVGGVLPEYRDLLVAYEEGGLRFWSHNTQETQSGPLFLSPLSRTFFGLESSIFASIRNIATDGRRGADRIRTLDTEAEPPSNMSFHKDGTLMAPIEFMMPVDVIEV